MKRILLSLLVSSSCYGAGLVNGTLSPVSGSGGSGGGVTTNLPYIYPSSFGAVGNDDGNGNGVDCTAALQAALNYAAANGGTIILSTNKYKITAPLVITNALNMYGISSLQYLPKFVSNGATNPVVTSFGGSTIVQCTSNLDVIQITNTGFAVNLADFNLTWKSNLMFIATGNGITGIPSPASAGKPDGGIFGSCWNNVNVFGTDGKSYGFYMVNATGCKFDWIGSVGGGGFYLSNSNNYGFYTGNSEFDYCGFSMCVAPSPSRANELDAFHTEGAVNLLNFVGCEIFANPAFGTIVTNNYTPGNPYFGPSAFWGNQHCFYIGDGALAISGVGNDIEAGNACAIGIRLPVSMYSLDLGFMGSLTGGTQYQTNVCALAANGTMPKLMAMPISWSANLRGHLTDDSIAGEQDFIRAVDYPDTSGNYYKTAVALTKNFERSSETVEAGHGWQHATHDSTNGSLVIVDQLMQDGSYTNFAGKMVCPGGFHGPIPVADVVGLTTNGTINNTFIYKLTNQLAATSGTPVTDAGYVLQPGVYSYTANLNAAALTNINGVYAELYVSNTAAISDSSISFYTFSGATGSSNAPAINASGSATFTSKSGAFIPVLAIANVSSGNVAVTSCGSGTITVATPLTLQYLVITSSGTVLSTTPAIIMTNSIAVFTKIQ